MTRVSSAATAISSVVLETVFGSTGARKSGSGCEPMTESTAILSAKGVSRLNGAAAKLTNSMPAMPRQYGRNSATSRR